MKKKAVLFCLAGSILFQSCGTVFGGPINECQKRGPASGGAHRNLRVGALIADILLFPIISLPVDFIDGGIYQPCASKRHR